MKQWKFIMYSMAILLLFSACESVSNFYKDNDRAYDSAVRIATVRLINKSVARANRAVELANMVKGLATDESTPADVIVPRLKDAINWQKLSTDEQILAQEFLSFVQDEINKRIEVGDLSADHKVLIAHTADLVIEVAGAYIDKI